MRWARVIIISLMAGLLQVSLMGALRIGGVVPNIALIVVVSQTIWGKASEALLSAVLLGLIIDVASAGRFGLATSSLVLISLLLVALYQLGLDARPVLIRLALVAGVTLVWGLLHVLALGAVHVTYLTTWRLLIGEVAINVVLAIPIGERVVRSGRPV